MIENIDDLTSHVEQGLYEAEQEGVPREEVADRLEELAACVRGGFNALPENRGEWYREVHIEDDHAPEAPADD